MEGDGRNAWERRGDRRRDGRERGGKAGERQEEKELVPLIFQSATVPWLVSFYYKWLNSAGTGRNGVPQHVSRVPPPEIAVPPPKVVAPPPGNADPSP